MFFKILLKLLATIICLLNTKIQKIFFLLQHQKHNNKKINKEITITFNNHVGGLQ